MIFEKKKLANFSIFGFVLLLTLILIIFLPLPGLVIDLFVIISFTLSAVLFVVVLENDSPLDLSFLPSIVLLSTVFRLLLSIATTKNILSGEPVGELINSIGEVVLGGVMAAGVVIYVIITIVQFLVVTKGAERVAEVGARFTLDAMPGKQMSIDSDLKAGSITAVDAQRAREKLAQESKLMGSLDGAMKFVKGDAIAGVLISCVNLAGGLYVGTSVFGMSVGDSINFFSILTIGDGLVSQVPSLILCLTCGVYLTRMGDDRSANSKKVKTSLSSQVLRQLAPYSNQIFVIGLLPILGSIFGVTPIVISLVCGGGCILLVFLLRGLDLRTCDTASIDESKGPLSSYHIEYPSDLKFHVRDEEIRNAFGGSAIIGKLKVKDKDKDKDKDKIELFHHDISLVKIDIGRLNEEGLIHFSGLGFVDCSSQDKFKILMRKIEKFLINHISMNISSSDTNQIIKSFLKESAIEEEVEKSLGIVKLREIIKLSIIQQGFFCPGELLVEQIVNISKNERESTKVAEMARSFLKFHLQGSVRECYLDDKLQVLLIHPEFEEELRENKKGTDPFSGYIFEVDYKAKVEDVVYNAIRDAVSTVQPFIIVSTPETRRGLRELIDKISVDIPYLSTAELYDMDKINIIGYIENDKVNV